MPLRLQQARPTRPQPGWAVQATVHEKWHAGERRSRHRHHPARPRQDAGLPAKADAAAARGVDGVSAYVITLFAFRSSLWPTRTRTRVAERMTAGPHRPIGKT